MIPRPLLNKSMSTFPFGTLSIFWYQHLCTFTHVHFEFRTLACNRVFLLLILFTQVQYVSTFPTTTQTDRQDISFGCFEVVPAAHAQCMSSSTGAEQQGKRAENEWGRFRILIHIKANVAHCGDHFALISHLSCRAKCVSQCGLEACATRTFI